MITGCDWWISIRSVDNMNDWRKFWKRFHECFVFQSRVSTKTVVNMLFYCEFSSNTNPKWSVIVAFLNFSCVAWTENIWCQEKIILSWWCLFSVKTPFSSEFSSFRSNAVRTGPKVWINKWSIRSHKLANSKREEILWGAFICCASWIQNILTTVMTRTGFR